MRQSAYWRIAHNRAMFEKFCEILQRRPQVDARAGGLPRECKQGSAAKAYLLIHSVQPPEEVRSPGCRRRRTVRLQRGQRATNSSASGYSMDIRRPIDPLTSRPDRRHRHWLTPTQPRRGRPYPEADSARCGLAGARRIEGFVMLPSHTMREVIFRQDVHPVQTLSPLNRSYRNSLQIGPTIWHL